MVVMDRFRLEYSSELLLSVLLLHTAVPGMLVQEPRNNDSKKNTSSVPKRLSSAASLLQGAYLVLQRGSAKPWHQSMTGKGGEVIALKYA